MTTWRGNRERERERETETETETERQRETCTDADKDTETCCLNVHERKDMPLFGENTHVQTITTCKAGLLHMAPSSHSHDHIKSRLIHRNRAAAQGDCSVWARLTSCHCLNPAFVGHPPLLLVLGASAAGCVALPLTGACCRNGRIRLRLRHAAEAVRQGLRVLQTIVNQTAACEGLDVTRVCLSGCVCVCVCVCGCV